MSEKCSRNGFNMRLTREEIHMKTAMLWAERSLCKQPNRKVGCVITSSDLRQVLSIGYNGPARHLPNDNCRGATPCGCLHAEMNAIAMLRHRTTKVAAFVTMEPCELCAQLLIQAEVCKVYYLNEYRTHEGLSLLDSAGVDVQHMRSPIGEISDQQKYFSTVMSVSLAHMICLELSKIKEDQFNLSNVKLLVMSTLNEFFGEMSSHWTLKRRD